MLVEAFSEHERPLKILLTIDLSQSVTEEAIQTKANFIMAYHPFIFRGLKAITSGDPQQRSLIKLIQNNISVYSPHTAVDSAVGGVNDFLVDSIAKSDEISSRSPIIPDKEDNCGMGRLVQLNHAIELETLVARVKTNLNLNHVQVAKGYQQADIKSIAICAGSGGSVFKDIKADLYLTGEMSHHEGLFFKESGSSVIICNHSNSERAFLAHFKQQLLKEIPEADIIISDSDEDPFEVR